MAVAALRTGDRLRYGWRYVYQFIRVAHDPKVADFARVHLKGWASTFIFDDQTFGNLGNDVRLQSPGYDTTAQHYDIEVASSASMVTITAE